MLESLITKVVEKVINQNVSTNQKTNKKVIKDTNKEQLEKANCLKWYAENKFKVIGKSFKLSLPTKKGYKTYEALTLVREDKKYIGVFHKNKYGQFTLTTKWNNQPIIEVMKMPKIAQ